MNWRDFLGSNNAFLLCAALSFMAMFLFLLSRSLLKKDDSTWHFANVTGMIVLLFGIVLGFGHFAVTEAVATGQECTNCGAEIHNTPYCAQCGAPSRTETEPSTSVCSGCGAECDTPFCGECGTPMNQED